MKRARGAFVDFLLRQWLLFVSVSGLLVSSIYLRRIPSFAQADLEIIFLLTALFVAVKGLENSHALSYISERIEQGRLIPLKLVCLTFFASMILTNDVALVVIVPLTLALRVKGKDMLVILESLAANAGSALTPFGNPQNLYIYWHYGIDPLTFITTIAPFSGVFFVVIALCALIIPVVKDSTGLPDIYSVKPTAYLYGTFLVIVILTILRVLPLTAGVIVLIYAVVVDRKSLAIDWPLLFTLVCFLAISENMKSILAATLKHAGHIFLLSAFSSQIISNVPAALLFAKFTSNWQALLWGTNVGGFGGLIGSLANLIAYRFYLIDKDTKNGAEFTMLFILVNYACFMAAVGLYFLLNTKAGGVK